MDECRLCHAKLETSTEKFWYTCTNCLNKFDQTKAHPKTKRTIYRVQVSVFGIWKDAGDYPTMAIAERNVKNPDLSRILTLEVDIPDEQSEDYL